MTFDLGVQNQNKTVNKLVEQHIIHISAWLCWSLDDAFDVKCLLRWHGSEVKVGSGNVVLMQNFAAMWFPVVIQLTSCLCYFCRSCSKYTVDSMCSFFLVCFFVFLSSSFFPFIFTPLSLTLSDPVDFFNTALIEGLISQQLKILCLA